MDISPLDFKKSLPNNKQREEEKEELYDLDLRIQEKMNSIFSLEETAQTWNCTGGRCSVGCQTARGNTCVRCGPTEYTTCGSCRCP